ncbi:MAG: tyrosine-type recombinase/integrase [Planctomycetota bacterium]|jgi:integrase
MAEQKITIYKDKRRIGGKPYLVRWLGEYDPQKGKQTKYCRSFAKRKDAELFAQQKKDEFDSGMPRDEISITLQQLTDKFTRASKNDYRNGTTNNYLYTIQRLKQFFSPNSLIKNIKQEHCEQFISNLGYIRKNLVNSEKELSDSHRNIQLRNSKRIFNKALEWTYIRFNPFEKIKQVKAVTRPWHRITVDEFNAILEKTPTLRKKVFYAVLYGCGLRMGEAINLLIDGQNLDFDNNKIHLYNRPATTELPPFKIKDFESRSVGVPEWVVKLLLQLYQEVDEGSPFLFLTRERWERVKIRWDNMRKEGRSREWENRNLCNNLLREFKRQCKNAGVKTNDSLTLHGLRKSWACSLAENGVPPQTLLKMGGWSDIETVQKFYLKSSDENERRAVEVLDRMMVGAD